MDQALSKQWPMTEQDQQISQAFDRDLSRLRNFIRRRVGDPSDAEDILQDVFGELIEAYRLMKPIEQVTAWLFRVARNRIVDVFRRRKRESERQPRNSAAEQGETLFAADLLPSPDAGPEAAYVRRVLLEELDDALDELPPEQRQVFIAHELMGYSFKEIAAQSGVGLNTLLARKRYAVLHLRRRLQAIHDEFVRR
jgi:RNA polymerase sigma factor (sigma-70 family)